MALPQGNQGKVQVVEEGVHATGTAAGGATGVDYNDNVKVRLVGNDLQIYHDGGSANYIDVYNKDLYIRCNLDAGITGGDIVLQPKSGENSGIQR